MWLRGSCAHILFLPSFHYDCSNYIKLLCWGVGWTFWWLDRWVGGWMELPYERMHNLSVKSLFTVIRTPWEKSRQSFSDQNSTWTCSGIFTEAHSAGGVAFRTPIKFQLSHLFALSVAAQTCNCRAIYQSCVLRLLKPLFEYPGTSAKLTEPLWRYCSIIYLEQRQWLPYSFVMVFKTRVQEASRKQTIQTQIPCLEPAAWTESLTREKL